MDSVSRGASAAALGAPSALENRLQAPSDGPSNPSTLLLCGGLPWPKPLPCLPSRLGGPCPTEGWGSSAQTETCLVCSNQYQAEAFPFIILLHSHKTVGVGDAILIPFYKSGSFGLQNYITCSGDEASKQWNRDLDLGHLPTRPHEVNQAATLINYLPGRTESKLPWIRNEQR